MHDPTLPSQRWWVFLSVLALAYFARIVFIPFVVAIFSAMLLWPVVDWLSKRGVSRGTAGLGVTVLFFAFIASLAWLLVLSVADIAATLPEYSHRITSLANQFKSATSAMESGSSKLFAGLFSGASAQKVQIISAVPEWSWLFLRGMSSVGEFLSVALLVPLLLVYFFSDKENLLESADTVLGYYAYLPKLHAELPTMVRAFVMGNLISGAILAAAQTAVLYFLGYANWASLGFVSGILNLVPVLGAPLAILFPFCQSIIQFTSATPFLLMAGSFFVLHFIGNNILLPMIVGAKTNVNPPALLLGLLFWSWLWGPAGFLLAIPLTALVKIFLESHRETVPVANLMAARPVHLMMSGRRPRGDGGIHVIKEKITTV